MALEGIVKTEEFFKKIEMPLTLTKLLGHKPSEEEIVGLVRECTYNYSRKIGSIKVLNQDDIRRIYEMSV